MSKNRNIADLGDFDKDVVGGAVAPSLLAEYIVTGSAVTSIDFSGLDINTHKSYRVEMEIKNNTASGTAIYVFVNNDTTITNYYTQMGSFIGTTTYVARTQNPIICEVNASGYTKAQANISLSSLYPFILSNYVYGLSSAVQNVLNSITKTATVTNITQLTFTSATASAIGVGSKIRIYRGDV